VTGRLARWLARLSALVALTRFGMVRTTATSRHPQLHRSQALLLLLEYHALRVEHLPFRVQVFMDQSVFLLHQFD
jgi:hypothetical protein